MSSLWRIVRDEAKFERVIPFGESLPAIRERTAHDLSRHGLPEEKMLAVVVRLLESTLIRIGDQEYVRQNQSFGLTTMLRQQVELAGARIRFHFRGKSGKHHDIELVDQRLAAVIKRSQHLPGERLFEYADAHGHFRPVESTDVNRYLHQLTGRELTAKDFRTWGGTLMAYMQGRLARDMALPREALASEDPDLPLDEARLLVLLKSRTPPGPMVHAQDRSSAE